MVVDISGSKENGSGMWVNGDITLRNVGFHSGKLVSGNG